MAVGIIVEYNPFHNGHLHHLEMTKKMFPGEDVIAVMSGEFVQRGERALLSFNDRKEIALSFGVSKVFEIPQEYVLQSAKWFAIGAIKELTKHGVDKIVFGLESDDIVMLEKLSEIEFLPAFKSTLKKYMKQGNSYKVAYELATEELSGQKLSLPNDILGFEYIKAIKELQVNIKPYSIKRDNDYHGTELEGKIASATAIRNALANGEDVSNFLPYDITKCTIQNNDDIFEKFKSQLLKYNEEQLREFKLVDEGIEYRFKKLISEVNDLDSFINLANSKRYSSSRIKRTILNIILENKK